MAGLGYKNVKWFRDGIPAWVAAGYPLDTGKALPKESIPFITAEQLKGMLDSVCVLDIRPTVLGEMGKIRGSRWLSIDVLSSKYQEIPGANKKVVLVDHSGKQAIIAARFLKSKGFSDVAVLDGGFVSWVNQGFEVAKGSMD